MAIKDMVPFARRRQLSKSRLARRSEHPLTRMHEELDRLFGQFMPTGFRGLERFAETPFGEYSPSVEVKETDKEIKVSAELPGLDEKDVEVRLDGDTLIISGEKSEESEDRDGDLYHSERYYGSFSRAIPLGSEIDLEKAEAKYRKGVLRLRLPKTAAAGSSGHRIEVKSP